MSTPPNKFMYNGGNSEWQNDYSNPPDYYQTFNRNYDQAIGRFVSMDPEPESAESMTGYQYAGNNPIMMNDPDGAKATPASAWQLMQSDMLVQQAYQGPSDLGGCDGPTADQVWAELEAGTGPDIVAHGQAGDPNFLQNMGQALAPYLLNGALAMAAAKRAGLNFTYNADGTLFSADPNGGDDNSFSLRNVSDQLMDDSFGNAWIAETVSYSPISAEQAAALGATSNMTADPLDMAAGGPVLGGFWAGFSSNQPNTNTYSGSFVSGIANIAGNLGTVKLATYTAKSLGVASALLTGVEAVYDHGTITWGDAAKIGIGLITTFTPYGWVYSVADIGCALTTGKSITDRIGAGIDNL